MREVGIKELKEHASEIIRDALTSQEEVTITLRGKVVAHLVPVESPEERRERAMRIWKQMDELAADIGRKLPAGVSATNAVVEDRRAL